MKTDSGNNLYRRNREVSTMLAAVKGYYDGTQIVVDENDRKSLNNGDEVIITILGKLDASKQTRAVKRRNIIDMDKYVTPTGRSTEDMDNYIRELRDNDRF